MRCRSWNAGLGDEPRALDDEWSMRHRPFHLSMYAACTSPLLLGMVDDLFDNAERYRRCGTGIQGPDHDGLVWTVRSRRGTVATVEAIRSAARKPRADPAYRARLNLDVPNVSIGEFEQTIAEETARWAALVKATGFKANN